MLHKSRNYEYTIVKSEETEEGGFPSVIDTISGPDIDIAPHVIGCFFNGHYRAFLGGSSSWHTILSSSYLMLLSVFAVLAMYWHRVSCATIIHCC